MKKTKSKGLWSVFALALAALLVVYAVVVPNWAMVWNGLVGKQPAPDNTPALMAELEERLAEIVELKAQIAELENALEDKDAEIELLLAQIDELISASSVSFAVDSWPTVVKVANMGLAPDFYNIGDEKSFMLGEEEVFMQIWGFNHDDLADGSGKASITLGMRDLLVQRYAMNLINTNAGGWDECDMRNVILPSILAQFPSELQSFIKTVNKTASTGEQSTEIVTSVDDLFLFSYDEMIGDSVYNVGISDGAIYEYWYNLTGGIITGENKVLFIKTIEGVGSGYAFRSPNMSNSIGFYNVVNSGGVNNSYGANVLFGVCFGFCI